MSESYHTPEKNQPRHYKKFPPAKPGYKFCHGCDQELLLEKFHLQKGKPKAECIECEHARDRERNKLRYIRKTPEKPPVTKEGHKVCNTCFHEKPFEAFKKTSIFKDGHSGRCKQCDAELRANRTEEEKEQEKVEKQAYREAHLKEIQERDRKRSKTDRHHQVRNARARNRRAEQAEIRKIERENAPPLPPITHKICPKCDPPVEKPLNEFPLRKSSKDGHHSYCYECLRKFGRSERFKANKNRWLRERMLDPKFRETRRMKIQAWRKENAEEIRIKNREKYANDPKYARRVRRNAMAWIIAHPMEMREHQMRRKSRIKKTMISAVDYNSILERDGWYCYICDQAIDPTIKKGPESLAFDHVIPLIPRVGEPQGTHTAENIKPTHNICNSRKINRPFESLTPFDRRGPD